MSSHRQLTTRALHPLRILIALALSVAILPFVALPSTADAGVVEDESEVVEVVADPLTPGPDEELENLGQGTVGEEVVTPVEVDEVSPPAPKQTTQDTQSGEASLLMNLSNEVEALVCDHGTLLVGFEIDGNTAVCDETDWESTGVPGFETDPFNASGGVKDPSNYTQGSAEENHPSTWQNGEGTAPGKDDIGRVYAYDKVDAATGDTWSFIGFTRETNNGTTSFDVEYNQKSNLAGPPARPNRTPGDLLVQLDQLGSSDKEPTKFDIKFAYVWSNSPEPDCLVIPGYTPTSGWCPLELADAGFVGDVSDDQLFAEGGYNITDLLRDESCVPDFGTINIRSRASNQTTSALKDWVDPIGVNIPGNCKQLKIEKIDRDNPSTHLAGASFEIDPDPRPDGPADNVIITDNVDQDDIDDAKGTPTEYPANQVSDEDPADGFLLISEVEPGTYTITEILAPDGYWMAPMPPGGTCPLVTTDAALQYRCAAREIDDSDETWVFADEKIWLAPTVIKTASGTYDADYDWDIEKTVSETDDEESPDDSASQDVAEGDSATFYYGVTLTGTETKSNHEVTGSVTIVNPNDGAMVVTLKDVLKKHIADEMGLACAFDGDDYDGETDGHQVNVPPSTDGDDDGDELDGTPYAYTCDDTEIDADHDVNVATVTWDLSEYPQTAEQAWGSDPGEGSDSTSAGVSYTADETDKSVVVTDEYSEFGGPYEVTFGDANGTTEGGVYTRTWSYDVEFDDNPAGVCTDYDNTAEVRLPVPREADVSIAVVLQGELLDSDTAVAEVCVGSNLTVTKNVVTELTRSYAYSIDKSASGTTMNVDPATGKAIVGYTVVVTEGAATDSNWVMSGEITVTNPNEWDVTLDSISDVYDDVNCDVEEGANLTIPADDSRVFDYDCSFGNTKPDYDADNVATIAWDDEAFFTSDDSDDYTVEMTTELWEDVDTHVDVDSTMTKVNPTVTVVDNKTVAGQSIELGKVTWSKAGEKHTFTYSLQLQGSAGRCIPYTNTARISETGQSDSATVTVCWPVGLSVSKTAVGTYDRTYLWAIDKEADQTSVETDGLTGAEVNYTVTAIPDGYVDDGWTMSGTITVSNPNDYQWMTVDIADVPNIGGGATCTVINGDDVAVPAGTLVNGQIVPGTASRDYTCTVPQQPLYTGGTNTATITWAGGSASSGALPVVFSVDDETDDVVTVVDDKTVEGEEAELGDATWNDDDEPTVFTYSLDLEAAANECVDYVNTAEILETGQFVDVTVEACGPEVLPDEVVVPEPQPRPAPTVKGVETVLPATGGPQLGLTWAALALLLAGGALIISSRTRRSRA